MAEAGVGAPYETLFIVFKPVFMAEAGDGAPTTQLKAGRHAGTNPYLSFFSRSDCRIL